RAVAINVGLGRTDRPEVVPPGAIGAVLPHHRVVIWHKVATTWVNRDAIERIPPAMLADAVHELGVPAGQPHRVELGRNATPVHLGTEREQPVLRVLLGPRALADAVTHIPFVQQLVVRHARTLTPIESTVQPCPEAF